MPYEALWLRGTCLDASGGSVPWHMKCWRYECGRCFWELRRLVLFKCRDRSGSLKVNSEILRQKPHWRVMAEGFGYVFDDHFKPSVKACAWASRHAEADTASSQPLQSLFDVYTREETSVSTRLFLCIVLGWASSRYTAEHTLAWSFLRGFQSAFTTVRGMELQDAEKCNHPLRAVAKRPAVMTACAGITNSGLGILRCRVQNEAALLSFSGVGGCSSVRAFATVRKSACPSSCHKCLTRLTWAWVRLESVRSTHKVSCSMGVRGSALMKTSSCTKCARQWKEVAHPQHRGHWPRTPQGLQSRWVGAGPIKL